MVRLFFATSNTRNINMTSQARSQQDHAPSVLALHSASEAQHPPTGKKLRGLIVVALFVSGAVAAGVRLWWKEANFAETDDAYVSGHIHPVSSRVAGVVAKILVKDNDKVDAGQPMLELDSADNLVQIEHVKSLIAQVDAQLLSVQAQIKQANFQVEVAAAQLAQALASMGRLDNEYKRAEALSTEDMRAVSRQDLEAAKASRSVAQGDVITRQAGLASAREQVSSTIASKDALTAQRSALEAQLKERQLQLGYTRVVAPSSGRVGKRAVEVGQRVQPGQSLFAVVGNEMWVTANFKETQLAKMTKSQTVLIRFDAFPSREFHAHVNSFSPAVGSEFALLPPDNATGNFTRVVQRVPVKLQLDTEEVKVLADGRLMPGMSATATVDLRSEGVKP